MTASQPHSVQRAGQVRSIVKRLFKQLNRFVLAEDEHHMAERIRNFLHSTQELPAKKSGLFGKAA